MAHLLWRCIVLTQIQQLPIRTVRVVAKSLKGKDERPVLTTQSRNGEKYQFHLNSQDELDNFSFGQEFHVRLEAIPQRVLEETPKPVTSTLPEQPNPCPNGVFTDDYSRSEVCEGCPNLKVTEEGGLEMTCKLSLPKKETAKEE
jgi:hypothetical protein